MERRILFTADARFAVAPKTDGKPVTLTGYALVYGVTSTDRGGYKVRLMPGSAKFAGEVLALFHHDYRLLLGTTANGSLRLTSDEIGLKFEVDLPDTTAGRDAAELVGKRYCRGCSFAMVNQPDGASVTENGETILEATSFLLDEITLTPIPAFPQTSVDLKPADTTPGNYAARVRQAEQLERFRLASLDLPRETPSASG